MAVKFYLFDLKHIMARGHNIEYKKTYKNILQSVGESLLVGGILSF